MARKPESFEDLLEQTEQLVDDLERGELSLDESLRRYEKGVQNLRLCAKLIQQAEERVKVLVQEAEDTFRLDDFEEPLVEEDEE